MKKNYITTLAAVGLATFAIGCADTDDNRTTEMEGGRMTGTEMREASGAGIQTSTDNQGATNPGASNAGVQGNSNSSNTDANLNSPGKEDKGEKQPSNP